MVTVIRFLMVKTLRQNIVMHLGGVSDGMLFSYRKYNPMKRPASFTAYLRLKLDQKMASLMIALNLQVSVP